MSSTSQTQDADYTFQNLNRLLHRLQQNILTPADSDSHIKKLRRSQYERNRAGANLEYARTLLLRLEHSTDTTPPAKRARTSTGPTTSGIQEKRALLRRVQKRFDELGQHTSRHDDSGSRSDSDASTDTETKELLNRYAPSEATAHSNGAATPSAVAPSPTSNDMTLRQRHQAGTSTAQQSSPERGTTTSSTTLPPNKQTLFEGAPSTKPLPPTDTAKLLDSHDTTQIAITDSLLQLATALKSSTQQFSDSLDASNPIVDMAAQALDKNVTGMQKTAGQMGELRKMTSGWGWIFAIGLWARVGILWVVLVLIMGVMPKLRF